MARDQQEWDRVTPPCDCGEDGNGDETRTEADAEIPKSVRERIHDDPFCDHLGIDVVELSPGRSVTRLTVTGDLLNFHGTPHGGAVYSLADAAFAAASNSRGETALALETNVSYLMATEAGDVLTATATETHQSDRTAEYEVVITGDDEARVATFRGRVYIP